MKDIFGLHEKFPPYRFIKIENGIKIIERVDENWEEYELGTESDNDYIFLRCVKNPPRIWYDRDNRGKERGEKGK